MTKSQIAQVLEEIGTLPELKGENPFKIRAYANAARSNVICRCAVLQMVRKTIT